MTEQEAYFIQSQDRRRISANDRTGGVFQPITGQEAYLKEQPKEVCLFCCWVWRSCSPESINPSVRDIAMHSQIQDLEHLPVDITAVWKTSFPRESGCLENVVSGVNKLSKKRAVSGEYGRMENTSSRKHVSGEHSCLGERPVWKTVHLKKPDSGAVWRTCFGKKNFNREFGGLEIRYLATVSWDYGCLEPMLLERKTW